MVGQTLSHYNIQEELGSGGMGVVYRAYDTRLRRMVAIKVIGKSRSGQSAKLLWDEAWNASALNHPNICTIYEVGQTDECAFISMEYVEGRVLREVIAAATLPPATAINLGIQIAGAIAYAHQHGVIHRDLKSANVIVLPDNRIKVLDFGLAVRQFNAVEEETRVDWLMSPGTISGTLGYMSPEILRGEPAGVASDCWSLGVLLYEMLAGTLPFSGATQFEVTGAILYAAIPPLPASTPASLKAVVAKALNRNAGARFANVSALLEALESARTEGSGSATTVAARPSVLVLPFENLSFNSDDDYFSDGLTDEIITDLSSISALRVISRTSSMRLKGSAGNMAKIANDLRVHYVLEGSIRQIGSQLRITAKLIDTRTDSAIWANKYAGTLEDVFAIQEQVSGSIVEALKVKLTAEEARHLVEHPITDIRAYDAYLKAKREMMKYTKEALDTAVEYLRTSIAIEGENTLLTSALGQIYWQYVNAGISSDRMYLDRAHECAQNILAREPESHHGHRLEGLVRAHRGDFPGSMKLLKRALSGDPNDPDTLLWLSLMAGICGRSREARSWAQRLLEIDPLTPIYQILPGVLLVMDGAFNEGVAMLSRSYTANLDNPGARLAYGQALALAGQREQAWNIFDALLNDMPDSPFARLGTFYQAALREDREGALACLTPELEAIMGADPQYSWMIAQCFALIDDGTRSLDWLDRAFDRGFINYPLLATYDPLLANVRSEPRFQDLMRSVEDRWKAFEL